MKRRSWGWLFITAVTLAGAGCATMREFAQGRVPTAEIAGLRLDHFDLQQLGLVLQLKVNNPNSVGLQFAKLAYEFSVADNSLFKGEQNQGLQVAAQSTQVVEIPVTIAPAQLWQTVRRLSQQDRFPYTFGCVASFAVPVVGGVDVPLKTSGELPVLHAPSIRVSGLKRKALSLTRADLELSLRVENPNAFTVLLNRFNYDFQVNQRSWVTGQNGQSQRLDAKQAQTLQIPISLSFLDIGATAYQMLTSKGPLAYRFAGQFDFGSTEPFLKHLPLPVDYTGSLNLTE